MKKEYNTYKKSGVNISNADKLVDYISKISRKTYQKDANEKSFKNIGSFGSIFDLSQLKMKNPIIVSSTDGVGTKIEIANLLKKYNTIGIDLVAMCVNDLIVQGAKPIFF
jgi:phosphoribosylformylglycinamidine cyclo-ligase